MEIKRNEATIGRPEGDRVIDAPFVFIDIANMIGQLKAEDAWRKNTRNGITVFKSNGITQVITTLKGSEDIIDNEVDGFLTIHLFSGNAVFSTSEGDVIMEKGQFVTVHPHIVHSFKAVTDTVLLITTFGKSEV
jgi:quercetin dioxygenase-like cupin family protein